MLIKKIFTDPYDPKIYQYSTSKKKWKRVTKDFYNKINETPALVETRLLNQTEYYKFESPKKQYKKLKDEKEKLANLSNSNHENYLNKQLNEFKLNEFTRKGKSFKERYSKEKNINHNKIIKKGNQKKEEVNNYWNNFSLDQLNIELEKLKASNKRL